MRFSLPMLYQNISAVEQKYSRTPHSVKLLAVSKSQSPEKILTLYHAGQRAFGENYLQEALAKMESLKNYDIEWHFIGAIQSNKIREMAAHFDWVHSVDSLKIAERLNAQRPTNFPPLNICIQVNINEEPQKSGVSFETLEALALAIAKFDRLQLRGLMAIPAPMKDFDTQVAVYQKLYQAQQRLIEQGLSLDTLSMGMSADWEAAVAAGSTMIRLGTAIFGPRIPTIPTSIPD